MPIRFSLRLCVSAVKGSCRECQYTAETQRRREKRRENLRENPQDCRARPGARLRHCATASADLMRRGPGCWRIALSGAASRRRWSATRWHSYGSSLAITLRPSALVCAKAAFLRRRTAVRTRRWHGPPSTACTSNAGCDDVPHYG